MTTVRYPYQDEHGNVLYTKVRIHSEQGEGKNFYWEREENGETIKNIKGCRKVLYRLPQLVYAIENGLTIFLVEGEKDVHTLFKYIATTTTGTLEWHNDFTKMLKNADVVILFDYDTTGFKRKDLLCSALYGRVKRLRVVELPGLEKRDKHGQDISDWFEMGNTKQQFDELVNLTPDYAPIDTNASIQKGSLKIITLEDLLILDIPERKMLLEPFLTEQGLCMLYAKRGVGKTHIALGIACAVASGGKFLKWSAPEPRKVLYIDGEMPAVSMQQRLQTMVLQAPETPLPNHLIIITPDLQDDPLPDLSTKTGREVLEPYIKDADLIIVDNISSLFRSGTENEAESWQPIQDWGLALRKQGKSVLFVHHAGKSGSQRGTSKKEDVLDVVICLKQPDDYKAEQGACFEVHFEKTRHFSGEDSSSFHAQLVKDADGIYTWKLSNTKYDPQLEEIAKMREEGATLAEIMVKTKLTKSQVETKVKKAIQIGLLP